MSQLAARLLIFVPIRYIRLLWETVFSSRSGERVFSPCSGQCRAEAKSLKSTEVSIASHSEVSCQLKPKSFSRRNFDAGARLRSSECRRNYSRFYRTIQCPKAVVFDFVIPLRRGGHNLARGRQAKHAGASRHPHSESSLSCSARASVFAACSASSLDIFR